MTKIRIYGKELNRWFATVEKNGRQTTVTTQIELEYKEYDIESGELVGTGSEDFSKERYDNNIIKPDVHTWDGERLNKGGHKWWDYRGYVTINKTDRKALKQYMENKYNAEVQLRA